MKTLFLEMYSKPLGRMVVVKKFSNIGSDLLFRDVDFCFHSQKLLFSVEFRKQKYPYVNHCSVLSPIW